jgi:glycolate oxidase FAD binding subunit
MAGTSTSGLSRANIDWHELDVLVPTSMLPQGTTSIHEIRATRTVSPESAQQVSTILGWANRNGAVVSAQGGRTKQGWGNRAASADLLLSTQKISGIVEHAWEDMTFTVRAGMRVAELQSELAQHGQRLALDPLWPERCTIGGIIATNDSGALRIRYGSLRDLILGVTVVLADGTIARSGGKVVKNVAGYDLPKLMTGSMGTLAVITEATFRAHPLPRASRTLVFQFADVNGANRFLLAVNDSPLVPSSMQLRVTSGDQASVDIRFDGVIAGIDAQTADAIRFAAGVRHDEVSEDTWRARERVFTGNENGVVAKLSVLPSKIADAVASVQGYFAKSQSVIQASGLGLIRGEAETLEQLARSLAGLRESVRQLGGTLVVLDAPDEFSKSLDVYGALFDSHPLMIRVKRQFDANGILNRGRFWGGI